MKNIVISGINLFEGGPLSIYKDCLDSIIENNLYKDSNFTAFVHKKELFQKYYKKINIVELPKSRKNYIYRIWYEYVYFYFFSKGKNIDVWLSIHDITPNVKAKKRYVYCHNASPFYKMSKIETRFSPRIKLFNLFYKYLYSINIKKNDAVIVQQNWLKEKFNSLFNIKNTIVAYPSISSMQVDDETIKNIDKEDIKSFFYPSFPRVFKNFEVICESVKILKEKGITDFKVYLTIDGKENNYSKYIVNKYRELSNIYFVGLLNREEVYEYYSQSTCLIFPSKLETWGLPITEYKTFDKPIISANLDYAKETLGDYNLVKFFNPTSSEELANIMEKHINNTIQWDENKVLVKPDSSSWEELLKIILY